MIRPVLMIIDAFRISFEKGERIICGYYEQQHLICS